MIRPIHRRHRQRSGFTLVELLVVVVIIGALAALLFPMIRSMRTRADNSKCVSNLREWSTAIAGYAADHNMMVRYRDWEDIGSTTQIYNPYLGGGDAALPKANWKGPIQGLRRMCPAQTWTGPGNPPRGYSFVRGNVKTPTGSYAAVKVDTIPDDSFTEDSYYLSMVSNPAQFLTMIDGDVGKSIYRTSEITQYTKPTCVNSDLTLIRHGGSANLLFCDGHIETLKWGEINPDKSENTAKATGWLNMN